VKNTEDILPAGPNVVGLRLDHLGDAPDHHVLDGGASVFLGDGLERPQEVFLEPEVGKLSFFDELCGQLAQRVDCKEGNVLVRGAADPVEVLSYHFPNARPLQPDAAHVVVRDLNNFLQTKHARIWFAQLLQGNWKRTLNLLRNSLKVPRVKKLNC